jgi:hypothetical protein
VRVHLRALKLYNYTLKTHILGAITPQLPSVTSQMWCLSPYFRGILSRLWHSRCPHMSPLHALNVQSAPSHCAKSTLCITHELLIVTLQMGCLSRHFRDSLVTNMTFPMSSHVSLAWNVQIARRHCAKNALCNNSGTIDRNFTNEVSIPTFRR